MAKTVFAPVDRDRKPAKASVLAVRDAVQFPGVIHSLVVGREMSVAAVRQATRKGKFLLVVAQKETMVDTPRANDLYTVGTLTEVLHLFPLPDGTLRVVIRGLARVRVSKLAYRSGALTASYEPFPSEPHESPSEIEAVKRECLQAFAHALDLGMTASPEVTETLPGIEEPGQLIDTLLHHSPLPTAVKQALLEEPSVVARFETFFTWIVRETQVLELQQSVRAKVEREFGQSQREYLLREQLRAIQAELGEDEGLTPEGLDYRRRLTESGMPPALLDRAMQELRRMEKSPDSSPEAMVIRSYLDWLVALPWNTVSQDRLDVRKAAAILDREHFGLDKVKDRVLDYLAVRQIAPQMPGTVLCFVGPPGVGKTSIARAIAESMGREFHRISLGGVRDEAEIRGHRRTYIGSMPGRFIQALKQCRTKNPVLLLDEIDKMSADFRGDPTSALLEALDPEQNTAFVDHYIDMPIDLSKVMFLATANSMENVPAALRDRMEVILFPSYTEEEKLRIALAHLLPKRAVEHGLQPNQMKVSRKIMETVIREYTREAGVRALGRELSTLCRKTARKVAEGDGRAISVSRNDLTRWLGRPRFRFGTCGLDHEVGSATGLVVSPHGGDILTIEVSLTPSAARTPRVRLTGSLGDVMKESAYAALTYLRANAGKYGSADTQLDLHVHVPEGAVPKDGPSAGVTILTALVSAYSNRPVRRNVAMTGELTLRGRVLAVGGIRDKVLAAHRAGIRHVAVPLENERDLEDVPPMVRGQLEIKLVATADEVLDYALLKP